MAAVTIKSRILDALRMFWGKLKTTYVTSTASNAGDNLALAASAGYNLQTQINTKIIRETINITISTNTNYGNVGYKSGYILMAVTPTGWNTYTKYASGICDTGSAWAVFFNQNASSTMSVPCHCFWYKI